ncbi:MAG: monofunctional biosynthetic peptidoglycan transglycosylase [Myxococcota bacterium]
MSWRRRAGQGLRVLAILSVIAWVLPPLQVISVRFADPTVTPTMVGQAVGGAWQSGWVAPSHTTMRLEALGEHVPAMVVSAEDQTFFLHSGFDDRQICAAIEDWQGGERLRGASTISQQVARNLFLWQGGGFARKGLEAVYTVWLELLVPKKRILEIYLNIAETGPVTFGFEAAAQRWYGRPAAALTRDQAARLATLLPAPTSRDSTSAASGRRAQWVLRNPAPVPWRAGFEDAGRAWAGREARLPDCLL